MLEFFVLNNTVYIIKDNQYEKLWKYFIQQGIKYGNKATDLAETFKSQTIMLYAIFVHGKEQMDKLMDTWKVTKNDDPVNDMIISLGKTRHGNLIEQLIFQEITMQNVLYILQVCLEIIRKVQFTHNHKLIREFTNENPHIKIIEL